MKLSEIAPQYIGGLTHAHTVLSNHPDHRESNLTIDRIVGSLTEAGLVAVEDAPLQYVMLNEHPSDPAYPRRLGRLSLRGRRLLRQRRRPVVGRVPILYGLEVSILPNGATDLTPRLADRCPLVIASRHWLPADTERDPEMIMELFEAACSNPAVDVLGHPPRYIEDLPEVDWPRIFEAANHTGTAIEINMNTFPAHEADPLQLKFWAKWLKALRHSGVRIFIGTDLHNQLQLDAFISQWEQLDEPAGREENHLARFLGALQDAGIKPAQVVTADYERFCEWLKLDKSERARLHL
jgi:histidinol phosphatase-like PHP family hydrolase